MVNAGFALVTAPSGTVNDDSLFPAMSGNGERIAFNSLRDLTRDNPDGSEELFLYIAAAPSLLGTLAVDANLDGITDVTVSLYAKDNSSAYPDFNFNQVHDGDDEPLAVYSRDSDQTHVIAVDFPTFALHDLTAAFSAKLVSTVNEGVFTNPPTDGNYTIAAEMVSVDPEKGGRSTAREMLLSR